MSIAPHSEQAQVVSEAKNKERPQVSYATIPEPTPSDVGRLLAKTVRTSTGCLEWTGRRNKQGYGGFKIAGKWLLAHRVAFKMFSGDPDGKDVLHTCDNPPCVEAAHLWLGDDVDNARDRQTKGRGFTPPQPEPHQRARGGRNGKAVLTPLIARRIRHLLADRSVSATARATGVSRQTVRRVRDGVSYL